MVNIMNMDLVTLIGNLSTLCTMGLFLTGTQICHGFYKKGNVGEAPSLPFVSMIGNCFLWLFYGSLIQNGQIMFVNGFGLTMGILYSLCYLNYTQQKKKLVHQLIFLSVAFIIFYYYAFHLEANAKTAAFYIGLLASSGSVIMFGSPLASLKQVMKTQSTESLSFPLCVANFVVASEWFIYGLLISDYFVQIPNFLGAVLGFSQVALFCKFPSQSLATKSKLKENPIDSSV